MNKTEKINELFVKKLWLQLQVGIKKSLRYYSQHFLNESFLDRTAC